MINFFKKKNEMAKEAFLQALNALDVMPEMWRARHCSLKPTSALTWISSMESCSFIYAERLKVETLTLAAHRWHTDAVASRRYQQKKT